MTAPDTILDSRYSIDAVYEARYDKKCLHCGAQDTETRLGGLLCGACDDRWYAAKVQSWAQET